MTYDCASCCLSVNAFPNEVIVVLDDARDLQSDYATSLIQIFLHTYTWTTSCCGNTAFPCITSEIHIMQHKHHFGNVQIMGGKVLALPKMFQKNHTFTNMLERQLFPGLLSQLNRAKLPSKIWTRPAEKGQCQRSVRRDSGQPAAVACCRVKSWRTMTIIKSRVTHTARLKSLAQQLHGTAFSKPLHFCPRH